MKNMSTLFYRLDEDKNIIACKDAIEWARAFESMNRHVKETITPEFRISTVFIGMDMRFSAEEGDLPILFETMVFATKNMDGTDFTGEDSYCDRYCTYEEAMIGHDNVFNKIINGEIELKTRKTIKLNFKGL